MTDQTDRELLELAAKATGYEIDWGVTPRTNVATDPFVNGVGSWNPLTDDGDALRLAVKLHLMVDVMDTGMTNCVHRNYWPEGERHGDDPYAATRRAIVRAAAVIAQNGATK